MFLRNPLLAAIALPVFLMGQPSLIQASSADVAAGKRIYLSLCKACHGLDGKGPGVMKLNPPAADLTSPQVQTKLDSRLYNSIHEGRVNTAMGAWKYELSAKEILDVMAYVRTLGDVPSTP